MGGDLRNDCCKSCGFEVGPDGYNFCDDMCDFCVSRKRLHDVVGAKQCDSKSSYYDRGGIITLDVIKAKLTDEQFQGYCLGNIIKYSCRANFKGDFKRDIEKIGYYSKFIKSGDK